MEREGQRFEGIEQIRELATKYAMLSSEISGLNRQRKELKEMINDIVAAVGIEKEVEVITQYGVVKISPRFKISIR